MKNIVEKNYGEVTVVERSDRKWGVIDSDGNEIVPFGKYGWIDGFEQGLCRVKNTERRHVEGLIFFCTDKWGIINEKGEEVLPCEYDNIWNFYGKGRFSTRVEKDGVARLVDFHDLNPSLPKRGTSPCDYDSVGYCEEERQTYDEYNGTYVQDEMGWSDQAIDDVLEGDPDAYWNID